VKSGDSLVAALLKSAGVERVHEVTQPSLDVPRREGSVAHKGVGSDPGASVGWLAGCHFC